MRLTNVYNFPDNKTTKTIIKTYNQLNFKVSKKHMECIIGGWKKNMLLT